MLQKPYDGVMIRAVWCPAGQCNHPKDDVSSWQNWSVHQAKTARVHACIRALGTRYARGKPILTKEDQGHTCQLHNKSKVGTRYGLFMEHTPHSFGRNLLNAFGSASIWKTPV